MWYSTIMAHKKKIHAKSKRRVVSRPKKARWDIKRIFLPVGVAVFALLAVSQVTYTQSFRSDILGDESNSGGQGSHDEEVQQEEQKHQEEVQQEEQKQAEEANRASQENGGSGTGTTQVNRQQNEIEIETADGVKVKSKVEDDGARKTEVESETVRYTFEEKDGRIRLRAETEAGEDITSKDTENEIEELEQELEDKDIEIASGDGHMKLTRNAVQARVRFPLSVDPVTGSLMVNTPAGEKAIAVLPDDALFRLMDTNMLSEVVTPKNPGGAEPAEVDDGTRHVELTEENGNLVYEIEGKKNHKLFGVFPVATDRSVKVSALTGEVLSKTETVFATILDALSL